MAGRQVAISRILVAVIIGSDGRIVACRHLADLSAGAAYCRLDRLMGVALLATVVGFRGAPAGGRFDLTCAPRYREILSNRRARALFGLVFVEAIAIFGLFPYLAPLIEARGGGGATQAGLASAASPSAASSTPPWSRWMLRRLGIGTC